MRHSLISGILLFTAIGNVSAGSETVEVDIRDYRYQPAEITVRAGTTVRWTNREKRQYHNVWFEVLGEKAPPYFFPEESYERSFDTPGEYPYRCEPHPEMRGLVRVVE